MTVADLIMEWTGLSLMAVGVLRMPDAFTRGHTGGKADSPGFMFCLLGAFVLWLRVNPYQSRKLLLLLVFMFATNPIVIHTILGYCHRACSDILPRTRMLLLDDRPGETQTRRMKNPEVNP